MKFEGIKKIIKQIRGRFPSALPQTKDGFHAFIDSILDIYDLPDMPSYRHAIASMVLHLDPLAIKKPKYYFAASVKKAMANQIAYDIIQDINSAQKKSETIESESIQ